jgi:hypothetical protein
MSDGENPDSATSSFTIGMGSPGLNRSFSFSSFYSGSPIAVRRRHGVEWLFPQEKATLHITGQCT